LELERELGGGIAEDIPKRVAGAAGIFADIGAGSLGGCEGAVVGVVDDVVADGADVELEILEGLIVEAHEDEVAVAAAGGLPLEDVDVGLKRARAERLAVGRGN
jgi:hypothetical protein